jgi:aspartyl protease family protein
MNQPLQSCAAKLLVCVVVQSLMAGTGAAQTLVPPRNGLPLVGGPQGMPLVGGPAGVPLIVGPDAQPRRSEASARREPGGHYIFEAQVNGAALPMLFDTGASSVVIRSEDAGRVGVNLGGLHYTQTVSTANGTTKVAPTTIATVTVGGITRRDVPAFVALPGVLNFNLLGQSFLARIAGYHLDGDQLILQGE